jgi:methyl-accepting chemotaxis protein
MMGAKAAVETLLIVEKTVEQSKQGLNKLHPSIEELEKSSEGIQNITTVINDIAFQTNLLALNAAVEAARAGEAGKGFSVVAESVRTLAQKSANASHQIQSLLSDSTDRISENAKISASVNREFDLAIGQIFNITKINQDINISSESQTQGIRQISQAMLHLDQASQNLAKSAEEVSQTAGNFMINSSELKGSSEMIALKVIGKQSN